ncbi:MAG: peroxiredoxin-like family protein [Woeseiaceae bacterium]
MKSLSRRRVSPRSMILAVFSGMMILSLTCSMTIRAGHADRPIAAAAEEIEPLVAGDVAPRFMVRSVDGANVHFDPASLARPVILITFRGGWCPYCNMHLSDLRNVMAELTELDLDVMFLSGDRPALLYASLSGETQADIDGLGYEIYSDADADAAIALGIAFRVTDSYISRHQEKGRDIAESSMTQHGVLPVPAVYAIDKDGTISYSFVEPDYQVWLDSAELLEVAKALASTE